MPQAGIWPRQLTATRTAVAAGPARPQRLWPQLLAIGVAALALSLLAVWLVLESDHIEMRAIQLSFGLTGSWTFIGAGLYAWHRRPASRFGALMVLVGFCLLVTFLQASNAPLLFTIGLFLGPLALAAVAHLLLAYPTGRLEDADERRTVIIIYAVTLMCSLPSVLFGDRDAFDCERCPESVVHIASSPGLYDVLNVLTGVAAFVLVLLMLHRMRSRLQVATAPQRRAFAPVLAAGGLLFGSLGLVLVAEAAGAPEWLVIVASCFAGIGFVSVPLAFLFGILRSSIVRAARVGNVLSGLGATTARGGLRQLLADALGDPQLSLAYWLPERGHYADADGRRIELPGPEDPMRTWTEVSLQGRPVGAIVHDATLEAEEAELVATTAAAAALAMENLRLEAELRARVAELERSRARLVDVSVAERRRLERNLHDGAQQRLVALSLQLRLAKARVEKDPERAQTLLDGAQTELQTALEELRELARGIHPAVLSEQGLPAALAALAERSPVPVHVAGTPEQRLPPPVEAAAYYVIAEALTNVAKYAQAQEAVIRVARDNGHATIEVSDDGVGGADPARGTGLAGLVDRLAALDGRLSIESPAGGGTRLRAEIPCAS